MDCRQSEEKGLLLLDKRHESKREDSHNYVRLLKAYRDSKDLVKGRVVHDQISRSQHYRDRLLLNLLVEMYGKCGSVVEARKVFESIDRPNVYSWNIMTNAYAQNGYLFQARRMFDTMPERDCVSWNSIVTAYAQAGYMDEACYLFEKMPARDRVSWNTLIAANAQSGHFKEALGLFRRMDLDGVAPDEFTFISVLDACSSLVDVETGRMIHESAVETGYVSSLVVGSSLVNMYGKCGRAKAAEFIFWKMPRRNIVSWTAMISAYSSNGHWSQAITLFSKMDLEGVELGKVTFVAALDACGSGAALETGRLIHSSIEDRNDVSQTEVVLGTCIIDMYGKCKSPREARLVFDKMPEKNVITWTAMIAGYAQNGHGKEGVALYRAMDLHGEQPNFITFVSALDACSLIPSIASGRIIHEGIPSELQRSNVIVSTAIVTMYARCGSMDDARRVFDWMEQRTAVSWNAMVAGYTQNGRGLEAFEVAELMDVEGIPKNDITFSMLLAACSRSGLVSRGRDYFVSMMEDYAIQPNVELFSSMVDVLARGGRLFEAQELVTSMPFEPNDLAWATLLGACVTFQDPWRSEQAKDLFRSSGGSVDQREWSSVVSTGQLHELASGSPPA
ncbi:pentatricopeptide repeat-containing protein At2g13600 isoform X1 [Selaginella moellendorffii]|uniref:pentatricopeptide repeat-containing protein At2g13600 isoform X1 n=1 Tax=Selaginella moellendorffii TaxID=88036 RepID=UPI000D1C6B4D|nr:pentatricopeptide repeat-containing protein At2g13600 isoform X1 [Selaginella moellendorffii]|eukprot:XP_024522766.1 pentatricopeptide repeat-containing protein At2g13600 isoform X1 [Selaginella moellendorffii]